MEQRAVGDPDVVGDDDDSTLARQPIDMPDLGAPQHLGHERPEVLVRRHRHLDDAGDDVDRRVLDEIGRYDSEVFLKNPPDRDLKSGPGRLGNKWIFLGDS